MAAQGYGSVVRMTAATVLVWAIFALPFMSSAMPPPDTETTTTEHQDVLHLYPELLEGLDYSDKQGTVKSVHDVPEAEVPEEALVISEKQALSEAELRRREVIFRNLLTAAIQKDKSLAALMLRYVFHDAYTVDPTTKKGGCNGSIRQELDRIANTGLDKAVALLTPMQKHSGLGWGDVSAVAGAVAVEVTGGPKIVLKLGRRESNDQDPVGILPSPRENIRNLQASFKSRGFSDLDLASLSGGHTLGKGFGVPFVSHPNKFANE